MRVLGIDPGLHASHLVIIDRTDAGYDLRHAGTLTHEPTDTKQLLATAAGLLASWPVDLVAIEYARGEVYAGRSGDGVLLNNLVAGMLTVAFAHPPAAPPVLLLPPSGEHGEPAWRTLLGVRAHTDAGVMEAVVRHLRDDVARLPVGRRGGRVPHYYDAAGLALAVHERILARNLEPPHDTETRAAFLDAFRELDPLERAVHDHARTRRRTRRAARKAKP